MQAWVSRYEKDAQTAALELLNFFVRCCGCKRMFQSINGWMQAKPTVESFTAENISEDEIKEAVDQLVTDFAEVCWMHARIQAPTALV